MRRVVVSCDCGNEDLSAVENDRVVQCPTCGWKDVKKLKLKLKTFHSTIHGDVTCEDESAGS